jgi:hypothetical protein
MKRKLLLGAIVPVLGFVAAVAFPQATTATKTHVYIAGEVGATGDNTVPVYWKDGVMVPLRLDATYTNGWAVSITEDKVGNIYVVGGQWKDGSTIHGYWKNSTFTRFTPPPAKYFFAFGIAVDSAGNVWVEGNGGPSPGPVDQEAAYYWKNGGNPVSLGSGSGLTSAVADGSGNVYFAGVLGSGPDSMLPYHWKNGRSPEALSIGTNIGGYVSQVALDASGSLYASGQVWSHIADRPVYWKATNGKWGEPIALPMGKYSNYAGWGVQGMAVDPQGNIDAYSFTDLYASIPYFPDRREGGGVQDGVRLLMWKGASSSPTEASLGGNVYMIERPNVCALDANGNFFIAGSLGPAYNRTKPYYWKNGGDPIPLNTSGNAFGQANGIVIGP